MGRACFQLAAVALLVAASAPAAHALDASTYAYPLKVSPNGHHLVDQAGKPFRIHGDAAWSLVANLTSTEVATYLDDRQARGFNTVLVNLLEHRFASNAPANRAGVLPFSAKLGEGAYAGGGDLADLTSSVEAYFSFADTVIDAAAARGLLVLLAPAYVGFGAPTTPSASNEGWSADMNANSAGGCFAYGQFVGARYKSRGNILWVNVADAMPSGGSAIETCARQVMAGIKAAGDTHLHTGHLTRGSNSTADLAVSSTGSWDVNSVYVRPTSGGGMPFTQARDAYGHAPPFPAYVIEDWYEGSHGTTAATLRYATWGDTLSTIGGYVFGNSPLWGFGNVDGPGAQSSWKPSLASSGAQDMQRMGAFLDGVAWQELVPSPATVTAGAGAESSADYVTAAVSADGSLVVAYVPPTASPQRTFSVDMGFLCAASRARWFDPTSGGYAQDATGLTNSGVHDFTTPGANAGGARDWVLVLDLAGAPCAAPPQRTPTVTAIPGRCGCTHGSPVVICSLLVALTVWWIRRR